VKIYNSSGAAVKVDVVQSGLISEETGRVLDLGFKATNACRTRVAPLAKAATTETLAV